MLVSSYALQEAAAELADEILRIDTESRKQAGIAVCVDVHRKLLFGLTRLLRVTTFRRYETI